MKHNIHTLIKAGEHKLDKTPFRATILMILLFLTFWGVSFYVLVNSMA